MLAVDLNKGSVLKPYQQRVSFRLGTILGGTWQTQGKIRDFANTPINFPEIDMQTKA